MDGRSTVPIEEGFDVAGNASLWIDAEARRQGPAERRKALGVSRCLVEAGN